MLTCHKRKNTAPGTKEFAIGTKVWRKTEILNVFKIFIQKSLPPHISFKQLHFPCHQNCACKQIQTSHILYLVCIPNTCTFSPFLTLSSSICGNWFWEFLLGIAAQVKRIHINITFNDNFVIHSNHCFISFVPFYLQNLFSLIPKCIVICIVCCYIIIFKSCIKLLCSELLILLVC